MKYSEHYKLYLPENAVDNVDIDVVSSNFAVVDTKMSEFEKAISEKAGEAELSLLKEELSGDINKISTEAEKKVDKVSGKGLSSNDFTTAEKNKLAGISASANNYSHPTHSAWSSGLYKVTVDSKGHVVSASKVTKSDITALGIPGQDTDTTYSVATTAAAGLLSAEDKEKIDGMLYVETGIYTGNGSKDGQTINFTGKPLFVVIDAEEETENRMLIAARTRTTERKLCIITPLDDAAERMPTIKFNNTSIKITPYTAGSTISTYYSFTGMYDKYYYWAICQ